MRIERLIPCPPLDLRRALIHHTELDERGAVLRLALPGGVCAVGGTLTVYESQKVLECGDVTLLVFTHAEDAAPWLACLDGIVALATRPDEMANSPGSGRALTSR